MGRLGIDLGAISGEAEVGLGSCIDLGSTLSRFRVELGSKSSTSKRSIFSLVGEADAAPDQKTSAPCPPGTGGAEGRIARVAEHGAPLAPATPRAELRGRPQNVRALDGHACVPACEHRLGAVFGVKSIGGSGGKNW